MRALHLCFEKSALTAELRGIRALETEDRLLLVAHGKDRAWQRISAHAVTGEEFLRELADDLPLFGAGVLRLIDEDMVEPTIELVEHPGRRIAALEQVQRGKDQIVIVERGATALQRIVNREHGEGDRYQGSGQSGGNGASAALFHRKHPFPQPVEERRRCAVTSGLTAALVTVALSVLTIYDALKR